MQKNFADGEIHSALSFIRDELAVFKLSGKDLMRVDLVCEEALLRLMKYSDFASVKYFKVRVKKTFGNILVDLSVPGPEFDFAGSIELFDADISENSPESYEAIQNIILRSFIKYITFRHSGKFNIITITALISSYSGLYKVLTALVLAVAAGLSMRAFLSEDLCRMIDYNIFSVISGVFLNGLKMCTVPIVFFSIILCFADIRNLRGIKRAGMKLLICFIIFHAVSVMSGFGLVYLFGTGRGAGLSIASDIAGSQEISINFRDAVINLMPDNMIESFLGDDIIQLVIAAVLTGLAAGTAGAKTILRACSDLSATFIGITQILIKFVPIVIFSSVSSMIITMGFHIIISFTGILFTLIAGYAVLNIIYYLAVKFFAGLNPVIMYKKFLNSIITAFTTCSSGAAIPDEMIAANKMGISKKFYPFSIPVGMSLNKDGGCIYMSVIVLSAVNMYGLNLSLVQIIFAGSLMIILASVSDVGPSALLILFPYLGLPSEIINPIMAITSIEDMFETPANCLGNISATLIAAKSENLLDIEEYNRP